jgi:hypothetical protein
LPLISVKAKVLYFIWKSRGFEANYNNLGRALGYQDDRRIRDVVNDSLEDGTLKIKSKNNKDYWITTNKAEGTIGLFILPLTQDIVIAVLGVTVLASGLDEYFLGYRIPSLSIVGLGIFIIIICAFFWSLQRKLDKKIWELARSKPPD